MSVLGGYINSFNTQLRKKSETNLLFYMFILFLTLSNWYHISFSTVYTRGTFFTCVINVLPFWQRRTHSTRLYVVQGRCIFQVQFVPMYAVSSFYWQEYLHYLNTAPVEGNNHTILFNMDYFIFAVERACIKWGKYECDNTLIYGCVINGTVYLSLLHSQGVTAHDSLVGNSIFHNPLVFCFTGNKSYNLSGITDTAYLRNSCLRNRSRHGSSL